MKLHLAYKSILLVILLRFYAKGDTANQQPTSQGVLANSTKGQGQQYKGIVLENGLKVVLVHDPAWVYSAASISVAAGHMSSPVELPGMAHLTEHLLFTRNKAHPAPYTFSKFVSSHAGTFQAETDMDHTAYYFEIQQSALPQALEHLFHAIASPLLKPSFIAEEASIMESEFIKGASADGVRYSALQRTKAQPGHPFSRFCTGNEESIFTNPRKLGINVTNAQEQFYNKYYSANLMNLAVVGSQPLAELEAFVVDLFSQIENKGIEIPFWDKPPYGPEQLGTKLEAVPLGNQRELDFYFQFPKKFWEIMLYYVAIFEHEGKGSLAAELKKLGYISYLTAERAHAYRGYYTFYISLVLTPSGLENERIVEELVFEYISMLRKIGPQDWFWEEMQEIKELRNRFREPLLPIDQAKNIAIDLLEYSLGEAINEAIYQNRSAGSFPAQMLEDALQLINSDNVRLTMLNPTIANSTKLYEPIYKVRHNYYKIDPEKLKEWKLASSSVFTGLPPKNNLIPKDFEIKPAKLKKKYPELLQMTNYSLIWFLQDTYYKAPKAFLRVRINNPHSYLTSTAAALNLFFVKMLSQDFMAEMFDADKIGVDVSIETEYYGITLGINGYSDRLDQVLNTAIDRILNRGLINEKNFLLAKDLVNRSLVEEFVKEPCGLADSELILLETKWSSWDVYRVLESLTFAEMENFYLSFLSRPRLEWIIYGNLYEKDAKKIVADIESKFSQIGAKPGRFHEYKWRPREVELEPDTDLFYNIPTRESKNSCTKVLFQSHRRGRRANLKAKMLMELMWPPAMAELRTKEQLGYEVWISSSPSAGRSSTTLEIYVQGEVPPPKVEKGIDRFLRNFRDILDNMTEKEFIVKRQSCAASFDTTFTDLFQQGAYWWKQIKYGEYIFNLKALSKRIVPKITLNELLDFYDEIFGFENHENGRRVGIHVIPENRLTKAVSKNNTIINLSAWKRELKLQPTPGIPRRVVVGKLPEN